MADEIKKIEKEAERDMKKILKNYWAVSTIILAVLLVVVLIFNYSSGVSSAKAGENIVGFLNEKVGGGVTLVNVSAQGNIYEVVVSYQNQDIPVYITKDGKYFLQGVVPIVANANTNTNTQTENIAKTDKPKVELYVMSFCPYGNEAEKTLEPVYNLLKDSVDWNIHFIVSVSGTTVSSLHGQPEAIQNEREACVIKNDGVGKWFTFANYVNNNCGSDGSCWESAATAAGVDKAKITSCVASDGLNLMKAEEAASNAAGASGSPTLIINGVQTNSVYQYGDSEAYKQAVCSAFTTSPAGCSQELTASASSTPSGSCA